MKFGAVVCLYDDHEYLEITVEPFKKHLEKILFLISDIPWNGKVSDNSKTIEFVKNLCKKNKNFELIQGHWINEIEQRNFGLELFYKNNIDYCFVLDNDEIYWEPQIAEIKKFAEKNFQVAAFHLEWNTYWKKDYYVITPREYYHPLVLVKVDSFKFTTIRHGTTAVSRTSSFVFQTKEAQYNGIMIPEQVATCFHLSYARDDEFMKRKMETNSHAPEFIKDWYERVWLKWKPSDTNLHPVTPDQYKQAVKEEFIVFPDQLKTFIKKERRRQCSIIILNWNSVDFLKRCFETIRRHTNFHLKPGNREIIVVDNGSDKDDSVEYIKGLNGVKKVFNEKNLGFAGGMNSGIRVANPKNDIVLMNVDAEPQVEWLEDLYETLESNPYAGIVGPLGNEVGGGYQSEGMIKQDVVVPNVHFYCALIFRELLNTIGLLDPLFEIGGYEDNDYCIRARLVKYQIMISAKSLVKHKAHQVFELNKLDYLESQNENEKKIYEKYLGAFLEYGKVVNYNVLKDLAKKTGLYV